MTKLASLASATMLALSLGGCTGSADVWGGGRGAAPGEDSVSASVADSAETAGSQVVVYNIDGAVGCQCNVTAADMARQAVEESFASDLAGGSI